MSNISQQRLIEMEAEMDRFEQEILAQDADDLPKVIIGSSTYNQVAAQLKMLRAATEHNKRAAPQQQQQQQQQQQHQHHHHHGREEQGHEDSDDEHDYDADQSRMLGRNEPPGEEGGYDVPLLPPPPPPPSLGSGPSFVPSQLRHRHPGPPRPGGMHGHGPPRMRPPAPRGYGGGGPQGPPGHMGGGPPGPRFMGGGPRPGGFGPMGPGPYGPGGPGGPGPHRGPHNMGPGPGGMGMPGGPRNMAGPQDMFADDGMYGMSSGEPHASVREEKKEPEGPKVVYASAPVITVKKEPKKKKKKKKAESTEESEKKSDLKTETAKPFETPVPEASTLRGAASKLSSSAATHTPMSSKEQEKDDLHVADMELDNPYLPKRDKKEKKKKFVRMAAGTTWEDQSLAEWGNDDFRLFCGDLGNEVTDEVLARAFSKYPSFIRTKVIRDKRTNKTKGYGFVSFKDPNDYVRAMREMNGKYVGNRPIKLRKSTWKERNIDSVKRKEKEKKRLGLK